MAGKKQKKTNFLIIDSNAIIHRAYHAIPATLYTKNNELVNAVFGFTSMLLNAMAKIDFEYIACAFDMSGPVFRSEVYADYKKTRKRMDDDLASQFEKIREVVRAFNIPIFEKKGYEADDIIGTLVKKVQALSNEKGLDLNIIIISGDRDILQLVDKNVQVVLPGKSFADMVFYDEEAVFKRFQFSPKQLIEYKALAGDTSDNIPGVSKIGDKTATDLVVQFGNIQSMYERIDEMKPAIAAKLLADKDKAFMSKSLATIHCDVPLEFDLAKTIFRDFDRNEVQRKFLEFEFKSLVTRIPEGRKNDVSDLKQAINVETGLNETQEDTHYVVVRTFEQFKKFLAVLKGQNVFSFDCETTSLDWVGGKTVGVSIGFSGKRAYYIPLKNGLFTDMENLDILHNKDGRGLWVDFITILASNKYTKVGHHAKFDIHALDGCGIKLIGLGFDTMLASYVLGLPESDLKSLGLLYEGVEMTTYADLSGKGKIPIEELDIENVGIYSCADADITFRLYERFSKEFEKNENSSVKRIFYDIEMPLIEVLFKMEKMGILLDVGYLENLGEELAKEIKTVRVKIYDIVGHEFNIASPKQLSAVIFDELGLPKGRKTKTGYSTDERYFTSIGDVHPIIKPLRLFKEYTKLKSTYIDTLPKLVDDKSRIHTSYNQTVAATGRLSSTNPNLQNIPVRTEIGNSIRKAFVVDPESIFMSFDYSQFELRILAHLSKDPALMESFQKGFDVHAQTARLIFGKNDITAKERSFAKTINFGIIYGMSSFGLAGQLGIPRADAQKLINRYFETYKGVHGYLENQKKVIEEKGEVESVLGRRRIFGDINRAGSIARDAMLREAINSPLQATNADVIKIAMKKVQDLILKEGYPADLLLQVHDELIFEYHCNCKESGRVDPKLLFEDDIRACAFAKEVKNLMEHSWEFDVPIRVDFAVGKNWGDLKDIDLEERA